MAIDPRSTWPSQKSIGTLTGPRSPRRRSRTCIGSSPRRGTYSLETYGTSWCRSAHRALSDHGEYARPKSVFMGEVIREGARPPSRLRSAGEDHVEHGEADSDAHEHRASPGHSFSPRQHDHSRNRE